MTSKECSVEGCSKTVRTRGYCQGHYLRLHRHGDVGSAETKNVMPLGVVQYNGAHGRIRRERGPASAQECVMCGGPAREWSLNYNADILIQVGTADDGMAYSLNPFDYSARCQPCHIAYDKAHGLMAGVPGPKKRAA